MIAYQYLYCVYNNSVKTDTKHAGKLRKCRIIEANIPIMEAKDHGTREKRLVN